MDKKVALVVPALVFLLSVVLVPTYFAAKAEKTAVDEQGELCFWPKEMKVGKGEEPAGWPFFDLKVNITNVMNLSMVVVSVHWDPALLNCTGFAAGDFLPEGLPNATGWMIVFDYAAGNMSEAANTLMAGKPLRTVTKPDWGWVFTLTFEYIGPSPVVGFPIDTDIIIVNQPDYAMTTCWQESWDPYHDFEPQDPLKPEIVCTCHLHYEFAWILPPPEACFTYTPPSPIRTYESPVNITVNFDATCSKHGCDGDDYTDITAYEWDVGDGTPKFNTTTPTMNHTYAWTPDPAEPATWSKEFTVNLTVYAPGIPPYIDPNYEPYDSEAHVVQIQYAIVNLATTNIALSKTVVGQGYSLSINVTVEKQGDYTVTFNVTAHANTTIIATLRNITLTSGNSTTITFTWNTTEVAKGNYTISAFATPVPGETHTADNTYTDGTVLVTIPGDVNGDYQVNYKDLFNLAAAYCSRPGDPNWEPDKDIDGDGHVGFRDLFALAANYGKKHP